MKSLKFSIRKFLKSFCYAAKGILEVYSHEQNFKVHTLMAFLAVLMGAIFRIALWEWCFLFLVIALVIASEMINTALEKLCDLTQPEQDERVRVIKDVSAGMVLVCAVGALAVGFIIFLPKLIHFLQSL